VSATAGIATWGPLVIGTDVDDAIIAALKTWMPTYLRQAVAERQLTFNLALPRSYANTFAAQEFLDHQLPAVVVTTARTQAITGGSNKSYGAQWICDVATVVRGKRPAATRYLAALYEGTARRLILQQAHADPLQEVRPAGLRYEQVLGDVSRGRYVLAAVTTFQVYTDQIVTPHSGPDIPDADVYVDEATVIEVDIDLNFRLSGGSVMPVVREGGGSG
jgi:hypothetical protein